MAHACVCRECGFAATHDLELQSAPTPEAVERVARAIEPAREFIAEYVKTYPECVSRGCTGVLCRPCAAKRALAALAAMREGAGWARLR